MRPDTGKEEYVEQLFASIAPRYDLLNSVLSFNRHKYWREFAVRRCNLSPGDRALDVAAGTLDLSFTLSRAVGHQGRVVGVDFCRPMLDIGLRKMMQRGIMNIDVLEGNAEDLPVPSDSFKAATIGFALRNVASVEKTLAEMTRVVERGGRVVSLELTQPENPALMKVYRFYSRRILPLVGRAVSGYKEAYEYLPESIERFYSKEELSALMLKVGLNDIRVYTLTFGTVAIHAGTKI